MCAAHVAGGLAGGALTALVVWFAVTPLRTLLPSAGVVALLVAITGAAIVSDVQPFGTVRRPGRQVPQTWRGRLGPYRGFAAYGAMLGAGLLTYVPYSVSYVAFAFFGLVLSLPAAVAAGGAFGAGRALAVALGTLSPVRAKALLFGSARVQVAMPWASAAVSVLILALGFTEIAGR